MYPIYFITAIDTDAGKSFVTGALGRYLCSIGVSVITQKMAQTGCTGLSEDIITHRRIMNIPVTNEDLNGETCAYLFPFPASPLMSSTREGVKIDPQRITDCTNNLRKKYEVVLLEGVGGLMVPLTEEMLVADYLEQQKYPTLLVTNGKLGSVNHTLLSIEALHRRGIEVHGLIYNRFVETDPDITENALNYLRCKLKDYYPDAVFVECPQIDLGSDEVTDFSTLFT